MSITPTPETDAAVVEASQYYQSLYPSANGRNQPVHADFARKLERERDAARSALNLALIDHSAARDAVSEHKCSTNENSHAWIGNVCSECGIGWSVWACSTIARLQHERDAARATLSKTVDLCSELTTAVNTWKAKAERTCTWTTREWSEFCKTECGESFPIPRQDKYKCCPNCGGRIVKEEK